MKTKSIILQAIVAMLLVFPLHTKAQKPMVIKAYPKEIPILTVTGVNYCMQSTGQYLVFDGSSTSLTK
jgi:hypothetical protein